MLAQNVLFGVVLVAVLLQSGDAFRFRKLKRDNLETLKSISENGESDPCMCGVFMSGQLNRTMKAAPPAGEPVFTYDTEDTSLPCGTPGLKVCINRCLDVIMRHLPKAGPLICGAMERDCHREKAFLYIRNCNSKWISTNFSAGREFCCTDGEHHKC